MKPEEYPIPIGKTLNELSRAYLGALGHRLKDLDLKRFYYPMLLICQYSGKINQKDYAAMLDIDKVTALRIIDYLHDHGYVKRVPCPSDRRAHYLEATPKAWEDKPKVAKGIRETNELMLKGLKEIQVEILEEVLEKALINLDKLPKRKVINQIRLEE